MLKVGLIGTGSIVSSHIEAYKIFKDRCKITALCDIHPEKSKEISGKHGINAEIYDDYHKLLKADVDLISVCTPPFTHADIAIKCMEAGKHVIVEKPMASSLEECDAMNRTAEKSGKVLSVIAQNRFRTPMMKLKQILDTGLAGSIVHSQVDSFWWRGHSYYDLWWRGTWEKEGGGCTLNHAVHHIDIFQWMKGMPSEVTAVTSNTSHDNAEVEDLSVAVCKYGDGSLAQITSSVVHHGEEQQLVFQGKAARVSFPWKLTASTAKENGFPERNKELEHHIQNTYDDLPEVEYEGYAGQIDDVLKAIEGKKSVLADGYQGRQTLELITAIYQSASENQTVKLPLSASSSFYTREGLLKSVTSFFVL